MRGTHVTVIVAIGFTCLGCHSNRSHGEAPITSSQRQGSSSTQHQASQGLAVRVLGLGLQLGQIDRKSSVDLGRDMAMDKPTALLYLHMQDRQIANRIETMPPHLRRVYLEIFVAGYRAGHSGLTPE